MNIEELDTLFEEFLESRDDTGSDNWYGTDKDISNDVISWFFEWYLSEKQGLQKKKTLAVDFDGVLHMYTTPIEVGEQHLVHDDPVPGAKEWLEEMTQHFHVVIYTARHLSKGGLEAAKTWMKKWGFPDLEVTGTKPGAVMYVDDRAWLFDGKNFPTVEEIKNFKPWNREGGSWNRE
jgi:hypothetical protein